MTELGFFLLGVFVGALAISCALYHQCYMVGDDTAKNYPEDGKDNHQLVFMKINDTAECAADCDCGCQDPTFTTPEEAVVFLYNRFMHAGVSDAVAKVYARDLKKIIDSPEFYNP